jgi:hypothetical protein
MNIHGMTMYVSRTAEAGVVSADTLIRFIQKGSRVMGRYSGGAVTRGCLIGHLLGDGTLAFRYVQRETLGEVHAGRSICDVIRLDNGKLRILEHFRWRTKEGDGTNVFDEL